MFKNKALWGILLAAMLITAQVAVAQAASSGQTVTPPTDTPTVTPTVDPCILPTSGTPTGGTPTSDSGQLQPVASALTEYFCKTLGIDYPTIEGLQQQGFGFGVIAQACFMAQQLGGDASLCVAILNAKQTGDYSGLTLPGGVTVSNWGQLKKAIMGNQHGMNLGSIVSGRAVGLHGHGNSGNGHGQGGGG